MVKKEKAAWVVLCVACLAALLIPVKGLLVDGVYAWHIRQREFQMMMAEVAVLFLLFSGIWLGLRSNLVKLACTAGICLAFIWCHVMFLPMMASGLYAGFLYLVGFFLRNHILKCHIKAPAFADVLLGSCCVITLFCLLSAVGYGSIPILRAAAVATGLVLWGLSLPRWRRWWTAGRTLRDRKGEGVRLTRPETLLMVLMLVMVLIQIGRMNISVDFDSLWYGVRSEYVLDNGRGIYENTGSIGLVYTYSKGLEVLLLPLSDLASHSYLISFNIWMALLTLAAIYQIARFYMDRGYAILAAAAVSTVPAVMNMSITAKTDTMTLLTQMVMVLYLLHYLKDKKVIHLLAGVGALFLSWTLKPTAIVFSTAVFGMSLLYLLFTRQLSLKGTWRQWAFLIPWVTALAGIWARTMVIVGIPVTSVFSSVFIRLGFQMKYPFAQQPLYGGGSEGISMGAYLLDTLYKMLLLPVGDSMSHVVFAWGTPLVFFFLVVLLVSMALDKRKDEAERNLIRYAYTVLIPFVMVCVISLMMLSQIDGNYFMLLDVFLILWGCAVISRLSGLRLKKALLGLMLPILFFNVNLTAVSNWAWSLGFTPVQLINTGRYNHRQKQQQSMAEFGNAEIFQILSRDPRTRVIAAGRHPQVFDFPCNVQSYDDITSAWGNVALVKTMDAFVRYLEYAETDYIYMQAGEISRDSRCYELMGYLIEAGILKDVFYENGNLLAAVDLEGSYGPEATEAYETYFESYQAREPES